MSTSNDVLDAARACLLRSAGRKITLAEVAREAGVSRPTVYRRFPEISSVIRDLLTREMARMIGDQEQAMDSAVEAAAEVRQRAAGGGVGVLQRADPAIAATAQAVLDSIVDAAVHVAIAVGDDALFGSLGRMQPELVAPYVFTRLGTSQIGVVAVLTERIERAQEFDAVRAGRPDQLAAMVLLIAQSAIQSRPMLEPILGAEWAGELRVALLGYLTPTALTITHRSDASGGPS